VLFCTEFQFNRFIVLRLRCQKAQIFEYLWGSHSHSLDWSWINLACECGPKVRVLFHSKFYRYRPSKYNRFWNFRASSNHIQWRIGAKFGRWEYTKALHVRATFHLDRLFCRFWGANPIFYRFFNFNIMLWRLLATYRDKVERSCPVHNYKPFAIQWSESLLFFNALMSKSCARLCHSKAWRKN